MELDVFISESLKAIIKGVKEVQEFARENGARINPHLEQDVLKKNVPYVFYEGEDGIRAITTVDFDVAVTLANEREKEGKGGINVLAMSIGGSLSDKDVNQTVSRIKFSVNVALPNVVP